MTRVAVVDIGTNSNNPVALTTLSLADGSYLITASGTLYPDGAAGSDCDGQFQLVADRQRPREVVARVGEMPLVEVVPARVLVGERLDDRPEPVGGGGDRLLETNNLLVQGFAVPSGLTAEHEEDRLAGTSRLGRRGRVVGVPAVLGGVELWRRGAGCGENREG